ncbi:hypothetical protein N8198_02480, partial [Gammaproteobacteria bacterium]|nr:hypothetical protein [Gammaproteobacteria bacterium]
SGPGNVSFGNASQVDTTASFSAAGRYVLQLEVSDSTLATSDQVTIDIGDVDSSGSSESAASIDLVMPIGFLVLMLLRTATARRTARGHTLSN